MAVIKSRPKVRLYLESEVRAGQEVVGRLEIVAKRDTPADFLEVRLTGRERLSSGRSAKERIVLDLRAVRAGPLTVRRGRSEIPLRFPIPADATPSYLGRTVRVEHTLLVHLSIPWWPDLRTAFGVTLLPPSREASAQPVLFRSAFEGPQRSAAYLEGSLASDEVEPGGRLVGAVALSNVAQNRYRAMRLRLSAVEHADVSSLGMHSAEAFRLDYGLPLKDPVEGQTIPFNIALPPHIAPSWTERTWRLTWQLDVRAEVRLRDDAVAHVPITILPRPAAGAARAPARVAPSVGSERLQLVWQAVAASEGLQLDGEALVGDRSVAQLSVRREQRDQGICLVGELRYRSLRLGLHIAPSSGLRLRRGRLRLGPRRRTHAVDGRDEQAAGGLLQRALEPFDRVELEDDRALVVRHASGEDEKPLRAAVDALVVLAQEIQAVRLWIPAPEVFRDGLQSWSELALQLHAPLDLGDMSVEGTLDGASARAVGWREGGTQSSLELRPPLSLPEEASCVLGGATAMPGAVGGASELVSGLVAVGELVIAPAGITLTTREPLLDGMAALELLRRMGRVCEALREGGPYR